MLLATVLDSFCISNNIEICKRKTVTIGRAMAIWTFMTQDLPQYVIHLLFIFIIESRIDHYGLTVLMSLVISTIAVGISAFNCIMCAPNEFDPMIVEFEFKKRKEADKMMGNARNWIMEKFRSLFVVPKQTVVTQRPSVSSDQRGSPASRVPMIDTSKHQNAISIHSDMLGMDQSMYQMRNNSVMQHDSIQNSVNTFGENIALITQPPSISNANQLLA